MLLLQKMCYHTASSYRCMYCLYVLYVLLHSVTISSQSSTLYNLGLMAWFHSAIAHMQHGWYTARDLSDMLCVQCLFLAGVLCA